jgi:Nuclear fragile X mental retardation-interacting protein 1 (NUFIP1)/CCCH-type zinc finger
MNTNAAAFAFILQQRRDLSASQSQTNNTPVQQRQQNYQGNASRSSTGNIPCATPQYQQYSSAPYQQGVYSNQQTQQTHSYSAPQINQGQGYSQYSQSVYPPSQYGWQPQYQQQQSQQQQQINQQACPGAPGCYQPSSSSLPQYSVPALPFQSSPIENNYLNQGYQYPYNNQMQLLPSHVKNTIASTLTALPGINNQYRQQNQSNKLPLTGFGVCKNSLKNNIDGSDISIKKADPPQLYYCEGCEKEFTQKSAYDAHCANHETCRHPGCTFSGTKKVVIAHFHGSHGLYSGEGYKMIEVEGSSKKYRVLLGVSPVEIEKWRMDRRKNFPTAENTLKKMEQKEELRKAGGLVIEKGKKRKRNEIEQIKRSTNDNDSSNNIESGNKEEESGMIDMVNGEKNNENDENTGEDKEFKLRKKPCVFFVKGTCKQGDLCTYSHDFEIKVCNFFVRSGRCTRGNKCTFSHDKEERAKFLEERKLNGDNKTPKSENETVTGDDKDDDGGVRQKDKDRDREKKCNKLTRNQDKNNRKEKEKEEVNDDVLRQKAMKKKGQLFLPKPYAGGSRGTLLRNLLLHEVEVEENILLQCLRLIVTNNYLQPVE